MRIHAYRYLWDVELVDDGTLDTVISIRPVSSLVTDNRDHPAQEVRFSAEYAAEWRGADGALTPDGLRALGEEAVEDYEFDA